MKFEQIDIKINDFILRIKEDGEWVRLDSDNFIEADDYHLDISNVFEVEALSILEKIFRERIQEYVKLRKKNKTDDGYLLFKDIHDKFGRISEGEDKQ